MKKTIDELEYNRGKLDAEHGFPPAALAGPYLEGYVSARGPVFKYYDK